MSLEGKSPEEIAALAALADDVMGNPKTSGVFQRLIKQNNPNVSLPLIELEDKAAAAFQKQEAKIAELQGQLAQRESTDGANNLYEHMKDAGIAYTRAEFNKLCTYATEHGFLCTEMGLRNAYTMKTQEETAAIPTPQTINHGQFAVSDSADLSKSFFRDPTGTAKAQAIEAMAAIAKNRLQPGIRRPH